MGLPEVVGGGAMKINVELEELMEFCRITGKPPHELLGITEENFKKWLDEHEVNQKPLLQVSIPSFEVEEK